MAKKDTVKELKALGVSFDETKSDKELKVVLEAAKAPAEPVDEAAKLEAEIAAATAAPEGVKTDLGSVAPAGDLKVVESKGEDGSKVRRLERPTGKFEAVGVEIFNRQGALVGTEEKENDAARKADRFNGLTRGQ